MSRQEATEQYAKALRLGQKYYRRCVARGEYPYPPSLNDILTEQEMSQPSEVGLVEIPVGQIAGTKSAGRKNAFAGNFMPLLPPESEFAAKWINLCAAHLEDEGLHDPVECYEYLGRFYIQEGNKRLSVLKSYGAKTVPALVKRILPQSSDDPTLAGYREFLRWYPKIGLYQVSFSDPESYPKLQLGLGYDHDHVWTAQERAVFLARFYRFQAAAQRYLDREPLGLTAMDILVSWLELYAFDRLRDMPAEELDKTIRGLWPSLKVKALHAPILVSTQPQERAAKPLLAKLLPKRRQQLNIAFFYADDPQKSLWVRGHDLGRAYLEQALGDQVRVSTHICDPAVAEEAMERAVAQGAEMIVATSPPFIRACRALIARHSQLYVLNCALSMPYPGVRTYYSRIYEGRFILGAVAAAVRRGGPLGYIANYPILGTPASINAFALGARMVDPDVRILLRWSCTSLQPEKELLEQGVQVISSRETVTQDTGAWSSDLGAYLHRNGAPRQTLGLPCWDWGKFYEQMARSVLEGTWSADGEREQAVNYWWGMDSGVIDVKLPDTLPDGVRQMADALRQGVISGALHPFHCRFADQSGRLRNTGEEWFTPEEIMNMDYLCYNVDGEIPAFEDLLPMSRNTVRLLGIYRDRIPPAGKETP